MGFRSLVCFRLLATRLGLPDHFIGDSNPSVVAVSFEDTTFQLKRSHAHASPYCRFDPSLMPRPEDTSVVRMILWEIFGQDLTRRVDHWMR